MDSISTPPQVAKRLNVFPDDYREADGLRLPATGSPCFDYSDGDAQEEYLLDTVRKATDRSIFSRELIGAIRDWSSAYHLSPKRANLLRPFSAILSGRVLEIGAGCGALTRYVGELGGDVVALEGSLRRAKIARERTADLTNVTVVVDRMQDFSAREPFDVILVIGVLEYARLYLQDVAQPEKEFLTQLGRLLRPDGAIILAIENKIGLKYFAGAAEDHLGVPFFGVNDNYTADSQVTFGREELHGLLEDAGFGAQRWYVPCPDYKLPTTVLSPAVFPADKELAATLLAQSVISDPQRPASPIFSLEQAWSVIEHNGLAEQMANSFLVAAGRTASAMHPLTRDPSLAWHYSTDRHPAFNKQARFVGQDDGIVVERSALCTVPPPDVPLEWMIESGRFVAGINWWRKLSVIVNRPDWTVRQVAEWGRPWIDALLNRCGLAELDGETFRRHVSGGLFDATPFNLVRSTDGGFHFIDQEWRLRPDIELGYIVLRGLRDSLARMSSAAAPAAGTPSNVNLLVAAIVAELGVMVTKIETDRFLLLEAQVQAWVQGRVLDDMSDQQIAHGRNLAMNVRAPLERLALIAAQDAALAERDGKIAELTGQLNESADTRDRLTAELDILKPTLDELLQLKAQSAAAEQTLTQARAETAEVAARLDAELKSALSIAAQHKGHADAVGTELASVQSVVKDRDGAIVRLMRDLDGARNYLRESQTQVQRLTGELDGARTETKRGEIERVRLAKIVADGAAELEASHLRIAMLQRERDGLQGSASQLPALRAQVEALKQALADARIAADRQDRTLAESTARLEDTSADKTRLAEELERTKDAARRGERSAADRIAALETLRAAAVAEANGRAQARIRALQDQLIDAETALAKYANGQRNGASWTRRLSVARRRALRLIASSGLFDADWYAREYPDAAASGRPPAEHYLDEGYLRGYRPNPLFDTRWYLEHYEDVRRAGINPLLHYIQSGTREGRDPGPDFHTDFYLVSNPDVRANGMNPLRHYLHYGRNEGRAATRTGGGH